MLKWLLLAALASGFATALPVETPKRQHAGRFPASPTPQSVLDTRVLRELYYSAGELPTPRLPGYRCVERRGRVPVQIDPGDIVPGRR
jgi:hypothetical protein